MTASGVIALEDKDPHDAAHAACHPVQSPSRPWQITLSTHLLLGRILHLLVDGASLVGLGACVQTSLGAYWMEKLAFRGTTAPFSLLLRSLSLSLCLTSGHSHAVERHHPALHSCSNVTTAAHAACFWTSRSTSRIRHIRVAESLLKPCFSCDAKIGLCDCICV